MSQELLDRAEKYRAKWLEKELTPGSGHHPEDRDPSQGHLQHKSLMAKCAPSEKGEPKYSERVVCFGDEESETFCFVGDDAKKVFDAMQAWLKKLKTPLHSCTGTMLKLATFIVPKAKLCDVGGVPRLTFKQNVFNDVHACLEGMKVGVAGAPMARDTDDPDCP